MGKGGALMATKFTDKQIAALGDKLDSGRVRTRKQAGTELSYIEGWWAIAEANRIFGFDGWHRETIELREIRPPELVKTHGGKEVHAVGYMAKVRVTVGDPMSGVVREGTGFGSGKMGDLGDAIESAIKEAETDAMKRALMTFGNPFGLALYDKERQDVTTVSSAEMKRHLGVMDQEMGDCETLVQLQACWRSWYHVMNRDNWPDMPGDETSFRAEAGRIKDRHKARIEAAMQPLTDAAE
jgi:DNA repair and recombination protein RAD52